MGIHSPENTPVGVTLGWDLKPGLVFPGGTVSPGSRADRKLYPEYFKDGEDWPTDPETGEMLPIYTYGEK